MSLKHLLFAPIIFTSCNSWSIGESSASRFSYNLIVKLIFSLIVSVSNYKLLRKRIPGFCNSSHVIQLTFIKDSPGTDNNDLLRNRE